MVTLPAPYLLFLGDSTEAGYAKTAYGLRDWARELCIGEFAMRGSDGQRRAAEARAARGAAQKARVRSSSASRTPAACIEAELDTEPARSPRSGTRHRFRHAWPPGRLARAQGRGRPARAAAHRRAPAAAEHSGRHRPQAHGQAPARRSARTARSARSTPRSRSRARCRRAASRRIFARRARPGS